MSDMGTFARSGNMAAAIMSGQDTSNDDVRTVAITTVDLIKALYEGQVKLISDLGITEDGPARSKNTGQPRNDSGGSGSGGSGLTENQREKVGNAISKLGDNTPYTIADLEQMSTAGGRTSERSTAIGKIFDAAYGGN